MPRTSSAEYAVDDAGVSFKVLHGTNDYARWVRNFSVAAELKGIWELYNGNEPVLIKPKYRDYGLKDPITVKLEGLERCSGSSTFPESDEPAFVPKFAKKPADPQRRASDGQLKDVEMVDADTAAKTTEYSIALKEFQHNEKRVRLAKAFLIYAVHDDIRSCIIGKKPNEAFKHLEAQYKMAPARARNMAWNGWDLTTLNNCNSVQEYFNKIQTSRVDYQDNGGTMIDDSMVISKIVRDASARFKAFGDQYRFQQANFKVLGEGTDESASLFNLQAILLDFESYKNTTRKPQVNFVAGTPDDSTQKKRRAKCDHCNKWGHKANKCWEKFPELKPADKQAKKDKLNEPNPGNGENKNAPMRKITAIVPIERQRFLEMAKQARPSSETTLSGPSGTSNPTSSLSLADFSMQESKRGRKNMRGKTPVVQDRDRSMKANNSCLMLASGLSDIVEDDWLIDSGANVHLCNDAKWFTSLNQHAESLSIADKENTLKIISSGTVEIKINCEEHGHTILTLKNVAYAPRSMCNLLSVSQLAAVAGIMTTTCHEGMKLYLPSGEIFAHAVDHNGLYILSTERMIRSGKTVLPTVQGGSEQNTADRDEIIDSSSDATDTTTQES